MIRRRVAGEWKWQIVTNRGVVLSSKRPAAVVEVLRASVGFPSNRRDYRKAEDAHPVPATVVSKSNKFFRSGAGRSRRVLRRWLGRAGMSECFSYPLQNFR